MQKFLRIPETLTVMTQVYMQSYQRMEGYAESLGDLAEADGKNGTALLNNNFFNQLEFVLHG